MRFLVLLAGLLGLFSGAATGADPYVIPGSAVHTLTGENGAKYQLFVRTPKGYEAGSGGGANQGEKTYTTLYLLDADYSFPLVHAIASRFEGRSIIPNVIIVGIAYPGAAADVEIHYTGRTRDYTPTRMEVEAGPAAKYLKQSGGADAFRSVLKNQIIPLISKNYRTNGSRTLIGHSFGGLFASHVMFTDHTLFDRYLIISPSLWYDDKVMFRTEQAFAALSAKHLPVRAYFAVGALEELPEKDRPMVSDLKAFKAVLDGRAYGGFTSRLQVFEGENHGSVVPAAITRGLPLLFTE